MHLMIPPIIFKKAIVSADPEKDRKRYFLETTLAGTLATTVYLLFLYPFDLVRLKLGADVGLSSSHPREFTGPAHALRTILRQDGLRGLYSGFTLQVNGVVFQRGLSYGLFSLASALGLFKLSMTLSFFIAIAITFGSEILSYPFTLLMKRMMMQAGYADKLYRDPWSCLKMTVQREGAAGLYRGYLLSLFIVVNRYILSNYIDEDID